MNRRRIFSSFPRDRNQRIIYVQSKKKERKRTVGISMFSASVNKPCNSSTVVDHGMLPTYKRLDCGCSVDMVFVLVVEFGACFNGEATGTDAVAASALSLGLETLNSFFVVDSLKAEKGAEDSQIMWRVLLETVLATGIFFGLYGAADAVSFV